MTALPDPQASARAARLVYVHDDAPGISRRGAGRGHAFYQPDGQRITDRAERQRLKSLAIPPAWQDVWISPDPDGHILATGRDARGRKQYIYHPRWHELREHANFERLAAFGRALPQLREAVDADLRRRNPGFEKAVALVLYLMERTLARVGNPEYAATNESYGLTTLTDAHVELAGSQLRFEFQGKSGKLFRAKLTDRRAARALRRLQELPGQHLFQYLDPENDSPRALRSDDVNEYLRQHTGGDFTAKDLRTWGGSRVALAQLLEAGPAADTSAGESAVREAIRAAARLLNNTEAVCRRHYVHPRIGEVYLAGGLAGQVVCEGDKLEALLLDVIEEGV